MNEPNPSARACSDGLCSYLQMECITQRSETGINEIQRVHSETVIVEIFTKSQVIGEENGVTDTTCACSIAKKHETGASEI